MSIFTLIIFIIQTAMEILKSQLYGGKMNIPESIVNIINAGYKVYELQVGKPLDPALIKPFVAIP